MGGNLRCLSVQYVDLHLIPLYPSEPYVQRLTIHRAEKELADFLCKEPNSKYLRLCGPCGLCYNYLTLVLWCENSHKKYISE